MASAVPTCRHCGEQLIPLFTGFFCKKDCDKRFRDNPACPNCTSQDTAPFKPNLPVEGVDYVPEYGNVDYHCWPCGAIWLSSKQANG